MFGLSGGEWIIIFLYALLILLAGIIVWVFYLMSLQKVLSLISEENREMSPGLVWLNLIPIFSLGWHIYTVVKITNSLKKEYINRQLSGEGDYGFGLGLAMSILICCSIIPKLNLVVSIPGLICWILYWLKTASFNRKLAEVTIQT